MIEGRQRGWVLAALGMLLVSTDSYFVRLADIDGWTMAFLVSVVSLPVQLASRKCGGWRCRRRVPGLAAWACHGRDPFGVSQVCFIIAITRTDVANVVVIVAASPIIAAVVGRVFFGERTNCRTWIVIGITVCGVVIVVSSSIGSPNLVGDLLALTAVAAFSTNMNVWRRYREQSRFIGLSIAASVTIGSRCGSPLRSGVDPGVPRCDRDGLAVQPDRAPVPDLCTAMRPHPRLRCSRQ